MDGISNLGKPEYNKIFKYQILEYGISQNQYPPTIHPY